MKTPLPPVTAKRLGSNIPRRGHWFLAFLGRLVLRLVGWRIVGVLPDVPKAVLIGAPHTSNYDGLVGISTIQALRLNVKFLAKDALFEGRKGRVMRWFGGIPVDRSSATDIVDQVTKAMAHDDFWLGITPEGTRSGAEKWKTGFYRIAQALELPIVVIGFCYRRQQIRVVDTFVPTGNMDADLERIYDALHDIVPSHPERLSAPLRFRQLSDRR